MTSANLVKAALVLQPQQGSVLQGAAASIRPEVAISNPSAKLQATFLLFLVILLLKSRLWAGVVMRITAVLAAGCAVHNLFELRSVKRLPIRCISKHQIRHAMVESECRRLPRNDPNVIVSLAQNIAVCPGAWWASQKPLVCHLSGAIWELDVEATDLVSVSECALGSSERKRDSSIVTVATLLVRELCSGGGGHRALMHSNRSSTLCKEDTRNKDPQHPVSKKENSEG